MKVIGYIAHTKISYVRDQYGSVILFKTKDEATLACEDSGTRDITLLPVVNQRKVPNAS